MEQTFDAQAIWDKIDEETQAILVQIFNNQVHGQQLPVLMMAVDRVFLIRDYLLMLGICWIPSTNGQLRLTYMGRLLVQTCADVEGL